LNVTPCAEHLATTVEWEGGQAGVSGHHECHFDGVMESDARLLRVEVWHDTKQVFSRDRPLKDDPAFLGVVKIRLAALWALLPQRETRKDARLSLKLGKLDAMQKVAVTGQAIFFVSVSDERSVAGEV
jgi:hypothetical protein